MEYVTIFLRTIFFYFLILAVFRIMGKREIGELSILDLIVYFMMSEVVVVAIEEYKTSLLRGIVPLIALGLIQLVMAYFSLYSRRFRLVLEGTPTIIIENGTVKDKVMRKLRYNLDDLLLQLREKGILDVSEVNYAILEPSGKLTVVKKENGQKRILPYPLIMDGDIVHFSLKKIEKEENWLLEEIKKRGFQTPKEIFYCSYVDEKLFVEPYEANG